MKTKYMILAVALLLAPTAMAQDYFAKLRYYFGENSPIVKQENTLTIHNTYYTSLNGEKEGELTIYKFKLPKSKAEYIDSVKVLYDAIDQLLDGKIGRRSIYTLWSLSGNKERTYTGYRLYYNKSESTIVGTEAENCYTVGIIDEADTLFRTTYTIEWSEMTDSGIAGRLITTYAPKIPQVASQTVAAPSAQRSGVDKWMSNLFFYLDRLKNDNSIYLSPLYSLAKNCDALDSDDLKVAIGQVKLSKTKFEQKRKDQSIILMLQQVAELLESKLEKRQAQ
ncbi:MAG: hypothetical protein L6U16_08620 [Porphyromonadaceae bacterium]|nr:MAG: hypothetical protein L6U16_08620 [Porphyromonadaceae bacterium]